MVGDGGCFTRQIVLILDSAKAAFIKQLKLRPPPSAVGQDGLSDEKKYKQVEVAAIRYCVKLIVDRCFHFFRLLDLYLDCCDALPAFYCVMSRVPFSPITTECCHQQPIILHTSTHCAKLEHTERYQKGDSGVFSPNLTTG